MHTRWSDGKAFPEEAVMWYKSRGYNFIGISDHNLFQDNPNKFFTPKKSEAELLWFSSGFVTYKFPNEIKNTETVKSLNLSLELCSETMYYRDKYPSDITFFVNDIELFTWTSPGDFGGRRGKYTPKSWPLTSTQFGLLKSFKIDSKGVTLDNILVNPNVTINDLNIKNNNVTTLTIKVKEDAIHKGGINIFGKNFGDYNQSIILTVTTI
jgi:predicted transcriptional regulator